MVKKYTLTNEHKSRLKPWADKWIANALSTNPMGDDDRIACVNAIHGLYAAANRAPPKHIVFCPSPMVVRFAGSVAAAIWQITRDAVHAATSAATSDAVYAAAHAGTLVATSDSAVYDATYAATRDATSAATHDATLDATREAVYAATSAAVYAATSDATSDATLDATRDATSDAVYDATSAATLDATRDAVRDAVYAATNAAVHDATSAATYEAVYAAAHAAAHAAASVDTSHDVMENDKNWIRGDRGCISAAHKISAEYGIPRNTMNKFIEKSWEAWSGGNQWSGCACFMSFFKDIAKLDIDYSKWQHWEVLAERSGPRIMYADFCMVSDRPKTLLYDEQNRPHCDTGPFCEWRDGTALYAIHGIYVPTWIITHPDRITVKMIDAEGNAEIRRIMMEKFGIGRYIAESGSTVISTAPDDHPQVGIRGARLLCKNSDLYTRPLYYVECINSTAETDGSFRKYYLGINPNHYNGAAGRDVVAALASTWRDPTDHTKLIFPRPDDYQFSAES